MGISFEVFDKVIVFKSIGEYTWEELLYEIDQVLSTIKDNNKRNIIFDERDATSIPEKEDLRVIVKRLKRWDSIIHKIALVVSKEIQYGMGRMAGFYIEFEYGEGLFNVFHDMSEANFWLDQ